MNQDDYNEAWEAGYSKGWSAAMKIAQSSTTPATRWAVFRILPNGMKTVYTVDTEGRAKQLAQETKDAYPNSRIFVGYEIAQSSGASEEDIDE